MALPDVQSRSDNKWLNCSRSGVMWDWGLVAELVSVLVFRCVEMARCARISKASWDLMPVFVWLDQPPNLDPFGPVVFLMGKVGSGRSVEIEQVLQF